MALNKESYLLVMELGAGLLRACFGELWAASGVFSLLVVRLCVFRVCAFCIFFGVSSLCLAFVWVLHFSDDGICNTPKFVVVSFVLFFVWK